MADKFTFEDRAIKHGTATMAYVSRERSGPNLPLQTADLSPHLLDLFGLQVVDALNQRDAARAMLAALEELKEDNALPIHNPQWPPFDSLEECPAGHEYECGACSQRRMVTEVIAQARAAGVVCKS